MFGFGCFEVFEVLNFDQTLKFFARAGRKLAEESELPARDCRNTRAGVGSFFVGLFGKCETKVGGAGSSQIAARA